MRKNGEKGQRLTRGKLELKLSLGKCKLKSGPALHSARVNYSKSGSKSNQIMVAPATKQTIWVAHSNYYPWFETLSKVEELALKFVLRITDRDPSRKIWIISSIDYFIDTYMELNEQLQIQCQQWFIISNAVNSHEMEQQFNKLYSPIRFIFLPTVSHVGNWILGFEHTRFQMVDIRGIFDLGLSFSSEYISIQDADISKIVSPIQNYLYIVTDVKQWMLLGTKICKKMIPYFVTGSQEFKNGKLVICDRKQKNKLLVFYVVLQCENQITKMKGFQEYERNYRNRVRNTSFIKTIEEKSQTYISKIVDKVLIPSNQICIFYQNISSVHEERITAIRNKLSSQYHFLKQKFYREGEQCYRLRWNHRIRSCQQFSVNGGGDIDEQVRKIQLFFKELGDLVGEVGKWGQRFRKMSILRYCKDKMAEHCIGKVLKSCKINVKELHNLSHLYQTHKITLIYGYLNYSQIKSLNNFYNVFVVPISRQSEQIAAFNQIAEMKQFLQTGLKAYQRLYAEVNVQPVQVYIHVLYEQQMELPLLLKSLTISQNILKTHYIHNFRVSVADFREFSKHLIISEMRSFTEELESMIRQVEWKWNTISIDTYLRYGQQFIVRNKEGSYKFIKTSQVQAKINYLQQCLKTEQSSANIPNQTIPQPILYFLPEVQKMIGHEGQLDNLGEESVVEVYAERFNKKSVSDYDEVLGNDNQYCDWQNEYDIRKSGGTNTKIANKVIQGQKSKTGEQSFIKMLSESAIQDQFQKIANRTNKLNTIVNDSQNNYYQITKNGKKDKKKKIKKENIIEFLGEQTTELLDIKPGDEQVNDKQGKMGKKKYLGEKKLSKSSSLTIKNTNQQKKDERESNDDGRREKSSKQQKIHSTNKNHQSRQNGLLIKNHKQYQLQPHKTATPTTNNDDLTFLQLTPSSNPSLSQLFIFIHRSVPHHSFPRRQSKLYHLLLYTRLQQILAFSRYIKPQQKIVVIASQQSSKIYQQLIIKSGVQEKKFMMVFVRDLSQNCIRREIDKIVGELEMEGEKKQSLGKIKKFIALVVYSSKNQRVLKSIKIIKKIFGIQLKLLFLKEKQLQELNQSKYRYRLSQNTIIYKIGLQCKNNQIQLTSLKNLFMLAMNIDLKSFSYDLNQIEFSYQSFIGRLIYGRGEKNYIVGRKGSKNKSDGFRKKIQQIKCDGSVFSRQDSHLSYLRTDHSQRRRSQTPLHSSIRGSSSVLLRQSSKIKILISFSLKQYYHSKNTFSTQNQLYEMIFVSNSLSKFLIIVLSQRQFDTFEIFQNRKYEQFTRQIIWIVESKIQAKKLFIGVNIMYCSSENIGEAIECVMQQYENKVYFDVLKVVSNVEAIKSGMYGEKEKILGKLAIKKCLTLVVVMNGAQVDRQIASLQKNKIILRVERQPKTSISKSRNLINFPSIESIKMFIQVLSGVFEGRPEMQSYHSFGSLLFIPKHCLSTVMKASSLIYLKDVMFEPYDTENLCDLVSYSIFRSLIVIDRDNLMRELEKNPYTIIFESNCQVMGKVLSATLL